MAALPFISTTPQAVDSQRVYALTLKDSAGNSLAGDFTGSETFAAKLWPGGALAALVDLSAGVAWADSANAILHLTVTPANLTGLEPATYRLEITINPGTDNVKAFDGYIKLSEAPGSTTAPAVYGTEADMLRFAPWIEVLQGSRDWAGFLNQRARARSWLDEILLSLFKWNQTGWWSGTTATAYWAYALPQYDPGPNKWLRDQLAANTLMVRDGVLELVSKKAIGYVCDSQLGSINETPFQALATKFHREADALVKITRFEIDLNNDGYYDILINGGSTTLR